MSGAGAPGGLLLAGAARTLERLSSFMSHPAALLASARGANALVTGGAALARRLGVRPLVAGLTLVAFGPSAFESLLGVGAALGGRDGIPSLGHVLGSNSLNIGLILGLTATVRPLAAELQLVRFGVPMMILVSPLFVAGCAG